MPQFRDKHVLARISRKRNSDKPNEELRLTLCEAVFDDGTVSEYVSVREFYTDQTGEVRPGKKGITFKMKEIPAVVDALQNALRPPADDPPADDEVPF